MGMVPAEWRRLTPRLPGSGAASASAKVLDQSHIPSHRGLVHRPSRSPVALSSRAGMADDRFDAIIVPAARTGIHLQSAAAVARRAGRALVVFCSRDCKIDEAAVGILDNTPGTDVFLIDATDLKPLAQFASDQLLASTRSVMPWPCDTSAKRNAGLALGRAMGWKSALFMDDDVRQLRRPDLRRAVAALRSYRVAGWTFPNFPDNSVVCHAYRRLPGVPRYGAQDTFIGGGGLALRLDDGDLPFFPCSYNEDWLFLYEYLKCDSVALMGSLHQASYDPFRSPEVAARQEFGDVLGEGLFRLLHGQRAGRWNADDHGTRTAYWDETIDRRGDLLNHLDRQWGQVQGGKQVRRCLAEARRTLAGITGESLSEYVASWRADQRVWRERLDRLPTVERGTTAERIDQALAAMGLPPATALTPPPVRWASRLRGPRHAVPRPRSAPDSGADAGRDQVRPDRAARVA